VHRLALLSQKFADLTADQPTWSPGSLGRRGATLASRPSRRRLRLCGSPARTAGLMAQQFLDQTAFLLESINLCLDRSKLCAQSIFKLVSHEQDSLRYCLARWTLCSPWVPINRVAL